jgi:hypothetical protein
VHNLWHLRSPRSPERLITGGVPSLEIDHIRRRSFHFAQKQHVRRCFHFAQKQVWIRQDVLERETEQKRRSKWRLNSNPNRTFRRGWTLIARDTRHGSRSDCDSPPSIGLAGDSIDLTGDGKTNPRRASLIVLSVKLTASLVISATTVTSELYIMTKVL